MDGVNGSGVDNGEGRDPAECWWYAMATGINHFGAGLRGLPFECHCTLFVSQVSGHAETYRRT